MLWKSLLIVFFFLVIFDGALRKWVAPDYSVVIYALKDLVLISACISFAGSRRVNLPEPLQRTWLPMLLVTYGGWVLVQAFNPNIPNIAISLLGIKGYLLYPTLLVLVPVAIAETKHPLRMVNKYVFLVAVPVLLLGIYQYFQPPTAWVNRYVADTEHITNVLGHPRVTGTFSYISGMATFIIFNIGLGPGIMLAGIRNENRALSWTGVLLTTLALTVASMTGSRSTLLLPLIPAPMILYLVFKKRGMARRFILGAVMTVMGVLLLAQTPLAKGWETIAYRIEYSNDAQERILGVLTGPIEEITEAGFIGFGAGSAHQAAPRLVPAGTPRWLPRTGYEAELESVTLELGILGMLLYLAIKVWVAFMAFRVLDEATEPLALIIGVAGFSYTFISLGVGGIVQSATTGALYWLLAGAVGFIWSTQRADSMYHYSRGETVMAPVYG